jgi:hypothetical protein
MPIERVRSERFLLPEIPFLIEPKPVDFATLPNIRILADDGSATGVIPHLGDSSWLRNPPAPLVVSQPVELKEFSQVVRCGESVQIMRWAA